MKTNSATEIDNELLKCNSIWLPWIGDKYLQNECKVLVVGESHYFGAAQNGVDETKNKYFTRECVQTQGFCVEDKIKIYRNLQVILTGDKNYSKENKISEQLWGNVAYYNLIQIGLENIKVRPSFVDFLNSAGLFFSILDVLKPEYCLMCGVTSENAILIKAKELGYSVDVCKPIKSIPSVNNREFPRYYEIIKEGSRFKLVYITHPSRQRNALNWRNYLKTNYDRLLTAIK